MQGGVKTVFRKGNPSSDNSKAETNILKSHYRSFPHITYPVSSSSYYFIDQLKTTFNIK